VQRKSLTAIQGYFIASIILMHVLFAAYHFWGQESEAQPAITEDTIATIEAPSTAETAITVVTKPAGPQPPEAGHIDINTVNLKKDQYFVKMEEDWEALLTLDPKLQSFAEKLLTRARVPAGAIVVLDLKTSSVLALADRIEEGHPVVPVLQDGQPQHLALRRVAPSASLFKIVSGASLLQQGLRADRLYPYRYAKRRITMRHLKPDKGSATADLASALAKSNNGFFAATASRFVSQDTLYKTANDFGFNEPVPFAALVEPSLATVPSDPLERARMAAGFWHSQLTPLHAAVIVQTVANGGHFVQPRLVDSVHHSSGVSHKAPKSSKQRQVISETHAKALESGLRKAVRSGTASRSFAKWNPKLSSVKVYGKTGTLGARMPDRTYTWFAGYMRGTQKDIVVAVLAINGEKWWRKAPHIAHDLLSYHATQMLRQSRQTP
jgi:penicillin-binding protein A